MNIVIISALASLGITLILTPFMKKIALKFGYVAASNDRTIHSTPIPYFGGLSIYLGTFLGILLMILCYSHKVTLDDHLIGYLIGGTIIMLTGLYDDIKGLNCYQKLFFQVIAAIVVIIFGVKINLMTTILGVSHLSSLLDSIITVLWIIGLANAFNLIDGLDGLAGGISIISLFAILSLSWGDATGTTIIIPGILIGSILGFLRYNYHPASIFMGDAGSLFLGFSLACISVGGFFRTPVHSDFFIPLLLFGVPIIDTSLAIYRRIKKRIHPFKADKEHIHHRLLKLGFSHRNVVILLHIISVYCCLNAFILYSSELKYIIVMLSLFVLFCFWGILYLGYLDNYNRLKQDKKSIKPDVFLIADEIVQ